MTKKLLVYGFLVMFIAIMIWSSIRESGIDDLKTKFIERSFVRNENNTGPVKRRYIVTASDTVQSDLLRYGNLMPYNKLGSTEVYFFLGENYPSQLSLFGEPFQETFQKDLIAVYTKDSMGKVNLKKY